MYVELGVLLFIIEFIYLVGYNKIRIIQVGLGVRYRIITQIKYKLFVYYV